MRKLLYAMLVALALLVFPGTSALAADPVITEPTVVLPGDKLCGIYCIVEVEGPLVAIWGTDGTAIVSVTGPLVSIWGTDGTAITGPIIDFPNPDDW